MELLRHLESVLFFVVGPVLWVAGLVLFVHSPLSPTRKALWFLLLIGVGLFAGAMLPFASIRDKFVFVLVLLPLLAFADVKLMRSDRGLTFWLRACGFEICTVFAVAATARHAFNLLHLTR